jgi:DNA-binding MarR family transcriptional regulator
MEAHDAQRCTALIDHLGRLSRARSEAVLAPLGLRPRHLVALTVMRDHGPSTQQDLAGLLNIDRTNLVGLLNELEGAGHVERRRSPEDRRRHIVVLTAAGRARLEAAEDALAEVEDEVLGNLSGAEREALYGLLKQATATQHVDCVEAAGLRQAEPLAGVSPRSA